MGAMFKVPAMILYIVGGLWGFVVCISLVAHLFGWIIAGICIFLFPVALYLMPVYSGLALENWFPALLVYGSTIGAGALYFIGGLIDGD